jgi:hypothetical protein
VIQHTFGFSQGVAYFGSAAIVQDSASAEGAADFEGRSTPKRVVRAGTRLAFIPKWNGAVHSLSDFSFTMSSDFVFAYWKEWYASTSSQGLYAD